MDQKPDKKYLLMILARDVVDAMQMALQAIEENNIAFALRVVAKVQSELDKVQQLLEELQDRRPRL